ncbi:twin-arginine translocation signal domain-containing protein [Haloarchaeobius sp. TZWSO28]|uniref:twin-arginine translocation signal domain-containing protein n=1 Tax=Haloarchaeobius sp. TZWSO28 TaxID=3446119 RepID=UPI003EBEF4DF
MTNDDTHHQSGGNETAKNRARENGAEAGGEVDSGASRVSRRDLLKGSGGAAAATFMPTSGIKGGSGFGLNNKGVPVVVLQGTRANPITPKQRVKVLARVHDEAVDRGREPSDNVTEPAVLTGDDVEAGESGLEETGDQNGLEGDREHKTMAGEHEIVGVVKTVTDDGVPRGYIGCSPSDSSASRIHGTAMSRARRFAAKNNSPVEIHKPNGKVTTLAPDDIGKARRVADVPGTTGYSGLAGSEYALLDETYQNFQQELDASLAMSSAESEDMDNIGGDYIDLYYSVSDEDKDCGRTEYKYSVRYAETGEYLDYYGLTNRYTMIPGAAHSWGNEWYNKRGKVRHFWHASDFDDYNLDQWGPFGTDTGGYSSQTGSWSITSGAGTFDIGYSMSWGYSQPAYELSDATDTSTEGAGWNMEVNDIHATEAQSTIGCTPGSTATAAYLDSEPYGWHDMLHAQVWPQWTSDYQTTQMPVVGIAHKISSWEESKKDWWTY